MASISKLAEKCKKCPHVDYCNDKRMEACAFVKISEKASVNHTVPVTASLMAPMARPYTPITINMGEYGNINTSMEEIKEKIKKQFYRNAFSIKCSFNKSFK
ncbi:hypothetical protein [Clostridium kluyveri]|uniref:Uncharacterized protein n=1 Tax=Clostridium kluyveri TaxID=1534 RepID=A0A1L5F8Q2_CLOKL|nr:hypothetical protein [Clostridium kluyveri]APM39394.1 hypothetical protein BS101_11900 [Clostridium kluyveri]